MRKAYGHYKARLPPKNNLPGFCSAPFRLLFCHDKKPVLRMGLKTSERLPAPRSENRLGIFFDLFRQLKVLIVNIMIFVFALIAAVFPADVRSRFVSQATIRRLV